MLFRSQAGEAVEGAKTATTRELLASPDAFAKATVRVRGTLATDATGGERLVTKEGDLKLDLAALPPFWIGIMLIVLFAVHLGWLPAAGRGSLRHLCLPAITLGLFPMARLTRVLRSSLLEVLQEDFIRTARAKGLAELRVLVRHGLRNASIPVLTVAGLTYGNILGGTVITESVFAWPGVGRLALEAVYNRDFPLVQAIVLVVAGIFVLINLLVDLAYGWLDPRIRLR